jgi:hypothetical protein
MMEKYVKFSIENKRPAEATDNIECLVKMH